MGYISFVQEIDGVKIYHGVENGFLVSPYEAKTLTGVALESIVSWCIAHENELYALEIIGHCGGRVDRQFLGDEHLTAVVNGSFASESQKKAAYDVLHGIHQYHELAPKQPRGKQRGYVYLIRSERDEYKIGKTKSINKRIAWFSVKLPFKIEHIHTIECEDMDDAEKLLHERYAAKRLHGEWFALTEQDVKEIIEIKSL